MPRPSAHARVCALLWCLALPLCAAAQDAQLTVQDGWAALEKGDASKAAAIFRAEIDRKPSDAWAHFGSAHAALALGRTDAALWSLKRAIENDPALLPAMVLLAQVAYAQADLDLAVRTLEKACALAPRDRKLAGLLTQWRKESALHQSFQTQPGVRFNVLFEGPAQKALGARVSAVLEAAYWSVGQALNIYPGAPLDVILYSKEQFRDITRAPAWAGGGYDGRIRIPVSGALRSPEALDRVLTHEYVHAVVRTAAPAGVPAWVNEGLASYLESGDKSWPAQVLRAARTRIPLEDLAEGFTRWNAAGATIAYAESQIAAQLLCERLGTNVGPFLQMLGNGHTVDQALSNHGVQPQTFYAEWRRRVGLE